MALKTPKRTEPLTPDELQDLSRRLGANADKLIAQHIASRANASKPSLSPTVGKNPAERRGRPPKQIPNQFYGFLGPTTIYGRYPFFAQDVVEGIARLDWHDRTIGKGGSSKPLSVRKLMVILEVVEVITTSDVSKILEIQARHAQRYVKAIELALPYLLRSRPSSLKYEMDLPADASENTEYWKKRCEAHPVIDCETVMPSPEELAKLRNDLGDDAFDPHYLISAAYYKEGHQDLPTLSRPLEMRLPTNFALRAGVAQAAA
jgi:hypothetical protein